MIQKGFILICLLSLTLAAQGQSAVSVQLPDKEYLIGDYLRLSVTATTDTLHSISWPAPESFSDNLDVISAAPLDTLQEAGSITYSTEIIFSAYDSGNYLIRRVPFLITDKQGTDTLYTDSIAVRIETLPVDTTQAFKPIKENLQVDYKDRRWMYYTAGGLVLLALLLLALRWWKRRRKQVAAAPAMAKTSLSQWALGQLQQIEQQQYWQQGQVKEYYTALTNVLRMYLEQRFDIPAMEATSDEVVEQMSQLQIETNTIQQILQLADMAKFAKSRPVGEQNSRAMELATAFVHQTTPDNDPEVEITWHVD